MLSEIMAELSTSMASKKLEEMKDADPEKYDKTLQMFITASDVITHFLKESPEFREAFARVHNEFLRHPECQSTIKEAKEAINKYGY